MTTQSKPVFGSMPFRTALGTLFPDKSTKRAGRFLDVSQRAVQRWVQEEEAPDDIMEKMWDEVERLAATGFADQLDDLISRAKTTGVHVEVVVAHLAKHQADLLDREID